MFRSAWSRRFRVPRFQLSTVIRYNKAANMSLKALSAKDAAALDKDLMDVNIGGWSLDQLMELAGLSVSQAVWRMHPLSQGKKILVVCGPGNNGGDGLVAARHLKHYGYEPTVYYPKEGKNELYQRLKTQLNTLAIPFTDDMTSELSRSDLLIDAIFGFSFGGPLRDPFGSIITQIENAKIPVLSVDAPSSWDINSGPPSSRPGANFMPQALISLTAPKPCVKFFKGRHFVGGRFLTTAIAQKYGLVCPAYEGIDQVVEVFKDGDGEFRYAPKEESKY